MFGFRSDGKKAKLDDPLMKMIPHIMPKRHDSQVHYTHYVECEKLDNFIEQERAKGVSYNYNHILYATFVRMHYLRPWLNRFVMNKRVYQRNSIGISMAIKRALKDKAEETTIKNEFSGRESIYDIKQIWDNEVKKVQAAGTGNETDKMLKIFDKLPNWLIGLFVGSLKLLDKWGMLPKKVIKASPFHTTMFLTNLKSIRMDSIYHHLYDFGTAGLFVCLSKEKMMPVYDEETNTFIPKKMLEMAIVIDERISNGLYWSNSIKLIKEYLENPSTLLERLPEENLPEIKNKKNKKEVKK